MKLSKIICLGFSGAELEDTYWNELDELTDNRVIVSELDGNTDADGLLVKLGAKVGPDIIDKLPNLKYIGMLGTGYGGIDTSYAASKGITVTNILLEYLRDIAKARSQAKAGDYSDNFTGGEIKGKKFGVIGLGDIGKRTAQLAQAFGADVCYWSRNRKPDAEDVGIEYCELDDLIKTSDIITLNLALNTETEGIINAERLAAIKHHAIFINPSPMELVNFDALVDRLKANDMVFMLDHSDEMSEDQLKALQPLENAIVYPAIAYITREAGQLKKRIYIDNIKNYLHGQPTNKVN